MEERVRGVIVVLYMAIALTETRNSGSMRQDRGVGTDSLRRWFCSCFTSSSRASVIVRDWLCP
jgi:hypothetical protein